MQAIAGLESAFDAPLFPTNFSHICCHKRAGWGRQNGACPRVRESPVTPLVAGDLIETISFVLGVENDISNLSSRF